MPLFPLIAGPDSLRESRSLSGNPHARWCGEGELEAPLYPIGRRFLDPECSKSVTGTLSMYKVSGQKSWPPSH
jgi:hypothetical protein